MKRSLALIATLASGFALSAAAQTLPAPAAAAPAGPAKIAVIAFQVAVAQTNEGQRDFADLQKKYAPKEAQLKTARRRDRYPHQAVAGAGRQAERRRKGQQSQDIDDKKKTGAADWKTPRTT